MESDLIMTKKATLDVSGGIGILGTGDFARALASRCMDNGIQVTIGSRNPNRRLAALPKDDIMSKVHLVSQEECAKTCDVIVVAMHASHHSSLQTFEQYLAGKILVDVSNSMSSGKQSAAESLALLLPSSHVVKAFNTISAYALMSEFENSSEVYVCGDDADSKSTVVQLATHLGFPTVDFGSLNRSGALEKKNRQLFSGWGLPTVIVVLMTIMWTVLALLRYFDWRKPPYTWERLPTNVVNKIVACVSITCLCLVYLPGCFAAITQLCWGTKHRRFHSSLDRFLKMRKPLGLYALLFGLLHMVMSSVLLSPSYYGKWYLQKSAIVPGNNTQDVKIGMGSRMNAVGETCVFLGVMAIASMALLGVTSLPSISRTLNWREWRCIQSYLGFACLLLATAHVTVKGATSWINEDSYKDYMATVTFFSLPLPWFTVLLKLILFLPCCHFKLRKIRSGWESGDDDRKPEHVATYNSKTQSTVAVIESTGHTNPSFVA